jgi:DNA-directed RNA polymerase specialized sigma24 family protein
VTELDHAFADAQFPGGRGVEAFGRWMALVERPLRASLRRFARAVDVESLMQETFLRVWVLLRNGDRTLEGDDASLRFALRIGRNVALEEVRRARLDRMVALDEIDPSAEPSVEPAPVRDPGLLRAIKDCVDRLSGKPREAMLARLGRGHELPDRDLAASIGMAVNTFLQNVVRARKAVAACLEGKGL